MKKLFSLILTVLTVLCFTCQVSYAAVGKQINANIKTKRVPAGSVLTLKVLNGVGSSTSQIGEQVNLMVIDDVKVNNNIVIPQGSVIRGSLEEVSAPKMLYKGGTIRLYFDHIVSSTGKQVPFYAGICNNPDITYDGALSSKTNYLTALKKTAGTTKDIVVTPVEYAWEKGENLFNGTPKYIFAPVTAIVATPVAGIYFIGSSVVNVFRKGEDVTLNQGETLQVQLLQPVDMPVY